MGSVMNNQSIRNECDDGTFFVDQNNHFETPNGGFIDLMEGLELFRPYIC